MIEERLPNWSVVIYFSLCCKCRHEVTAVLLSSTVPGPRLTLQTNKQTWSWMNIESSRDSHFLYPNVLSSCDKCSMGSFFILTASPWWVQLASALKRRRLWGQRKLSNVSKTWGPSPPRHSSSRKGQDPSWLLDASSRLLWPVFKFLPALWTSYSYQDHAKTPEKSITFYLLEEALSAKWPK